MYSVFLDGMLFPVTPEKLDVKIKGANKTLTLVNDGEVNFLKTPGLTEIGNLEVILPMLSAYPFAVYPNGFQPPNYYLAKLENLMTKKKPVQFIVSRVSPDGKLLFSTNMKVSVEEYTIKENASDGLDVTVSIKLKQYRDFATKTVNIEKLQTAGRTSGSGTNTANIGDVVNFTGTRHYVSSTGDLGYSCTPGKAKITLKSNGAKHPYHLIGGAYNDVTGNSSVYGWVNTSDIEGLSSSVETSATATTSRGTENAPSAKTHTVQSGDCLWNITKKYTGDGSRYTELYTANKDKISNPNLIYPGQVLSLPW